MDKYVILAQVGEGTFGAVYKARSKQTGEIVALKKMYNQNDEEGLSYFALQEIKYLKQLNGSPNVIHLIDSFIHEDVEGIKKACIVVVLPYYESDLVGAQTAFTGIREVKCAMQQILTGISSMHANYVMHRDIKPANMLMKDGEIAIADMGMTTSTNTTSPLPHQVVTLWYRPLELLFGANRYGPEVDVWSCGVLFIELMSRKCPFPGRTEHHQVELILELMGQSYIDQSEGLNKLSLYEKYMPKRELPRNSQLKRIFSSWADDALDLLLKMLCPAKQRWTASQLLDHPFFTNNPSPCSPKDVPKVPAMHEYEMKQKYHSQGRTTQRREEMTHAQGPPNKKQCLPNHAPMARPQPRSLDKNKLHSGQEGYRHKVPVTGGSRTSEETSN